MKITCIVLTRQPEIQYKSLQEQFDEVIIFVDGDGKPAADKNTKIIYHKLGRDYAAHRNAALKHAVNDWVVFVDEDETLSSELIKEMHSVNPLSYAGYKIKRTDTFMGKQLRFGETSNISLLRFAKKSAGSWKRPVHEVWNIHGEVATLKHALKHKPHNSIESFLEKLNSYTSIEVEYRKSLGKRSSLIELLIYPPAKFVQNYVLRLGFLDGFPGLAMAYMMTLHSLIVRVKMYETPQV